MTAQSPLPKDDPRLVAWEAYKATYDYANTRRWALHEEHVDGSLWAAFIAGTTIATLSPSQSAVERISRAIALSDGMAADLPDFDWRPWEPNARAALATLPASDTGLREADQTTYSLHHNPNCPKPFLVRLPRGALDLKDYAETNDACGFGMTFAEAFANARTILETTSDDGESQAADTQGNNTNVI